MVQGAITGLSYGLLALGLVLIYRTNRVLNFSQGQLGVVGAVFMVKLYYDFGINYWAAAGRRPGAGRGGRSGARSWCCAACSSGPGCW